MNLVGTNELMKILNIRSYTTVKKLEDEGVISPIRVGRVRKWNANECVKNVIEHGSKKKKNEKDTA